MDLIKPFIMEEDIEYRRNTFRGTRNYICIADIHFGVINPEKQYNILKEQFLNKIYNINFDILCIDGDLFDHKFTANSEAVMYAIKFVDECVNICRNNGATMILLHGTMYHDANQLKLFYHYLQDSTVDIRIVEEVKFEYIKGAKILCIPELYGKGKDFYNQFLLYSGEYDSVFMHGTVKNAVFGANEQNLDSDKYPVFDLDAFKLCRGPIICGHVHTPGCFETYIYYCGTPIRYRFGEEEEKGFIVLLHNLDTHEHFVHFETITSFRYDTINLDTMINNDPKDIIAYLKQLQASGIDNIRVEFTLNNEETLTILKNYYKNNPTIKIKVDNDNSSIAVKANNEIMEKYKEYDYILDPKLSEFEILTRYVNDQKGYRFITTEELIKILEEK